MDKNPVLVLAAGSLGDCVLTLPALQGLQESFSVTVAGTEPYRELGADLLGVSSLLPLDQALQKIWTGKIEEGFLKSFVKVFLFFKDLDPKLEKTLGALGAAEVHSTKNPFDEFLKRESFAGEFWREIIRDAGIAPGGSSLPRLGLGPEARKRGEVLCEKFGTPQPFVIHPGSGSPSKNAPLSFFKNAAQKAAAESGRKVLVLWGDAERGWLSELRETFSRLEGVTFLGEPLSLRDLAALFTQCSGYLGNDSGVTHLASACGAKTFAVFNQTDSRIWGPQEAVILEALKSLYA